MDAGSADLFTVPAAADTAAILLLQLDKDIVMSVDMSLIMMNLIKCTFGLKKVGESILSV